MQQVLKGSNILFEEKWGIMAAIMLSLFASYLILHPSLINLLAIAVGLIFIFSLMRLDWAICIFIFLSPFHYVIKEIYTSPLVDLWREIFFLCLLASWFIQICIKRLPPPPKSIVNFLIISFIVWCGMEIFNSFNVLAGIAGFRYYVKFIILYYIALSTIKGEKEIRRYINTILISGIIVATLGIIQFILESVLGVTDSGIFVDRTGYGIAKASGIGLSRATSVLAGVNEAGLFFAVVGSFLIIFNFYHQKNKSKYGKVTPIFLILVVVALFFTMSRSSMIAFVISIMSIMFLKGFKKGILWLGVVLVFMVLILPFSLKTLFQPVYTFSAPIFERLSSDYQWNILFENPFLGHGFSVTSGVVRKLGLKDGGIITVGSVDTHFLELSMQIGLIGYLIYFSIWMVFTIYAYKGAKSSSNHNPYYSNISTAIFAIFIAVMVASIHLSPWNYVSFDATYYVLGAIATYIYHQGRKSQKTLKFAQRCSQ